MKKFKFSKKRFVTKEDFVWFFLPAILLTPQILKSDVDDKYIAKFHQVYKRYTSDTPKDINEYALVSRYDELFMGDSIIQKIEDINKNQNKTSNIAWSHSYFIQSLNTMYSITKETKYLRKSLEIIRAILANTDEKKGTKTHFGHLVPAWGTDRYAKYWVVHAVHTGVITYSILEFLDCCSQEPKLMEELGSEYKQMILDVTKAIDWHDRQWIEGCSDEGCYISKESEPKKEGNVLAANRLSAMGLALWQSLKVTQNQRHKEKAIKLARYIKRRLNIYSHGAYYWQSYLPLKPLKKPIELEGLFPEDVSHGGITIFFPIKMAEANQVFDHNDMAAFSKTVLNGFGKLDNGVLYSNVAGNPKYHSPALVRNLSYWLMLSDYSPEVFQRISMFFLKYQNPCTRPNDFAYLIKYHRRILNLTEILTKSK